MVMVFLRQCHSTVHRETTTVQSNTGLTRTTHLWAHIHIYCSYQLIRMLRCSIDFGPKYEQTQCRSSIIDETKIKQCLAHVFILTLLFHLCFLVNKAAVNIWRTPALQWLNSQVSGSGPEFSQVGPGLMFAGSGTEIWPSRLSVYNLWNQ